MTSISPLNSVHLVGDHGNFKNKNSDEIINIKELKSFKIFQIVKFKKNKKNINDYKLSGLDFPDKLRVSENKDVRILWIGPNNWLALSATVSLSEEIAKSLSNDEFAITDLSHSKAIIELSGKNVKEVLKKGCPINFNDINKNEVVNSIFNGIAVTLDFINDQPDKIRVMCLRSFGESLYHSVTDAALEFGYKAF
jgi:heterotetrameric sarcosine oxidase gamma subunit